MVAEQRAAWPSATLTTRLSLATVGKACVADALDEQASAKRGQARVTMSHEGPPSRSWLRHHKPMKDGPSPVNKVVTQNN